MEKMEKITITAKTLKVVFVTTTIINRVIPPVLKHVPIYARNSLVALSFLLVVAMVVAMQKTPMAAVIMYRVLTWLLTVTLIKAGTYIVVLNHCVLIDVTSMTSKFL